MVYLSTMTFYCSVNIAAVQGYSDYYDTRNPLHESQLSPILINQRRLLLLLFMR
jgi:hypothetical protein